MKKLYFSLVAFLFFVVANAQIVNIPDANFKAKLLSANSSNGIASTQTPTYNTYSGAWSISGCNKIDINNDGEIQLSEASLIKYLKVNNSSIIDLIGLNNFTNLIYFDCSANQISNLSLNNLNNIQGLNCLQNQLSNIDFIGFNNFKNINCSHNLLSNLNLTGLNNMEVLDCSYNQLSSLNLAGLTSFKALKCDNNQITSINLNGLSNLTQLLCSYNLLSDINISTNTSLDFFHCDHNQLTTLNTYSRALTQLYCNDNLLISLYIKAQICFSQSIIQFNNNPTLTYICASESCLTSFQNAINSYGYSTTCNVNSYCNFNPGGTYYLVGGTKKIDTNNNGCDALDSSYPYLKFNINSLTYLSNNYETYEYPLAAGTYTITPQFENPTYFIASPTNTTVSFPSTTSPFIQNFCIVPNGVHHDLEVVVIPLNTARSGFDANYKIKYKNKGNQIENTTINFNYNDAILDFVSSSVSPTSQATGTLSFNVGTIAPFQSGEILLTLNLNSPTETPPVNAGTILSYTATVNGLITDETPDDNTFALNQVVVNSYDPNDKTCLEGTTISPSMIGKYVHYKIRFENTGTYPAQNIVVKDMIDTTKFDISTLQMTDASHSCVTKISNTNKVEFIFENINLPFDDANNDGYVVFKIKTKPTLVVGNTISNSANIYFDYNFPIVTNTATSTFQTLANNDFYLDKNVSLSPIPTKDNLTISLQDSENINSVSIYNMLGQVVQTVIGSSNTINVSELKTGDYIIKITTEKGTISKKFIKE